MLACSEVSYFVLMLSVQHIVVFMRRFIVQAD